MAKAKTDFPVISDTELRLRCVAAAALAMKSTPACGEAAQTIASNIMGLNNAFYVLAQKGNPAVSIKAIEAAAHGMQNAGFNKPSDKFAGDVLSVAEEFAGFANGAKDSAGYDPLASFKK